MVTEVTRTGPVAAALARVQRFGVDEDRASRRRRAEAWTLLSSCSRQPSGHAMTRHATSRVRGIVGAGLLAWGRSLVARRRSPPAAEVQTLGWPSSGVCVVAGTACDMGQSSAQAAYNLHDRWNVPFANIELTPMIGGNDVQGEQFTLHDVDTVAAFALAQGSPGCTTGRTTATPTARPERPLRRATRSPASARTDSCCARSSRCDRDGRAHLAAAIAATRRARRTGSG